MRSCGQARDLFGPYWDDEVTQVEREWLESHLQSCADCRAGYEQLARTLEALATLPREEAAPDLAGRALAAARRSGPAPDVIFVRETPRWVPVTAAAAAVLLLVATISPFVSRTPVGVMWAERVAPVSQPKLVRVDAAAGDRAPSGAAATGEVAAAVIDSLFDHGENVDFVLEPVRLRDGRSPGVTRLPGGIQAEQTVITF